MLMIFPGTASPGGEITTISYGGTPNRLRNAVPAEFNHCRNQNLWLSLLHSLYWILIAARIQWSRIRCNYSGPNRNGLRLSSCNIYLAATLVERHYLVDIITPEMNDAAVHRLCLTPSVINDLHASDMPTLHLTVRLFGTSGTLNLTQPSTYS